MRVIDRLVRAAPPARRLIALAALAGVAGGLATIAQANLLAAAVTDGRPAYVALAAVIVVRAGLHWAVGSSGQRAAAAVKNQLRDDVFTHTQRLGPSWLAQRRAGELTTLLTRGLDGLDPLLRDYVPALAVATTIPLAVLIQLLVADPTSGLVVAITLPLIPVFAALAGAAARSATERQWAGLARLGGHFLDSVQGLSTLRLFGQARAHVDVVRRLAEEHRRATMRTLRIAFLSALTLELVASLSVALVAVPVALRLLNGHLDLRTALLVLILAPEAYLPLRVAGQQFHAGAEGLTAANAALEILDTPDPIRADVPAPDLRTAVIELDRVSVQYPDRDRPAIENLSLRIEPGQQLALTGPSGIGKSTLLGLILGLVVPTSGRVLIDGIDLTDIDRDAWWRQVAWVPQRPHLFAGTIAHNVRLGRPEATAAEVASALQLAGLDTDPETRIGQDGLRLSTGQRQRVALARAMLRADAPLVLLDEPSAGLDLRTEARLADALRPALQGRTVIVAAHRPALLRGLDDALVLA